MELRLARQREEMLERLTTLHSRLPITIPNDSLFHQIRLEPAEDGLEWVTEPFLVMAALKYVRDASVFQL